MISSFIHKNCAKVSRISTLLCVIIIIAVIKSFSIWNYSHFNIDEQAVVNFAVGFLDYDFNPEWFGYHTLPMYFLYAVYHLIYYLYLAVGYVSTKSEFASLLFSNDKIFFITAKLVFSTAYTAGASVLAHILWRHFGSKVTATVFFLVACIFPDSLLASNWVRVDSFVFLFLALTVYYGCFAEKTFKNFVLSAVFATAAFCSKFPALLIPCILFLKLAVDIYMKEYPKRYLFYYLVLVPLCTFIFMPYAFLDFQSYQSLLAGISARSSGQTMHVGKMHLDGFQERATYILTLFRQQVGVLSIVGTTIYVALSSFRRDYLFPFFFVCAYAATFMNSLTIDSYWYRPIYPFCIFFTFAAIIMVTSTECGGYEFVRKQVQRRFPVYIHWLFTISLGAIYVYGYAGQLKHQFLSARDNREDTRVLSNKWINDNIPDKSTIWFDGDFVHYFPKVLANNRDTAWSLRGSYFPKNNYIIDTSFLHYFRNLERTHNAYDIRILGSGEYSTQFTDRLRLLRSGDYVVTSSYVYNRYYDQNAMKGLPKLAEDAQTYYQSLTKNKSLATFEGKGPIIDVYLFKK